MCAPARPSVPAAVLLAAALGACRPAPPPPGPGAAVVEVRGVVRDAAGVPRPGESVRVRCVLRRDGAALMTATFPAQSGAGGRFAVRCALGSEAFEAATRPGDAVWVEVAAGRPPAPPQVRRQVGRDGVVECELVASGEGR